MHSRIISITLISILIIIGALFILGFRPLAMLNDICNPIIERFQNIIPPGQTEPSPFPEGTEEKGRDIGEEDLAALYPRHIVRQGQTEQSLVALTFDDGPDSVYTPAILDILSQYDVKATFFLTGTRSEQFPEVVQIIIDQGHALGNHSYTHGRYSAMTPEDIRDDLKRTDDIFHSITLTRSRLFRPPYGALSATAAETVIDEGYTIILWSVDSLDWQDLSREEVVENIVPHVVNGSIILQHSAGGEGQNLWGTVEALPEIIETLQEDNFKFVTIPVLLERSNIDRELVDIRK